MRFEHRGRRLLQLKGNLYIQQDKPYRVDKTAEAGVRRRFHQGDEECRVVSLQEK